MKIGKIIGITALATSLTLIAGCANRPKTEEPIKQPVIVKPVKQQSFNECKQYFLEGLVDYVDMNLDSAISNFETWRGCCDFFNVKFDNWQYNYVMAMAYWDAGRPAEDALRILDETKTFNGANIYRIEMAKGDILEVEGRYDEALSAYLNAFTKKSTEEVEQRFESLFDKINSSEEYETETWGTIKAIYR